MATKKEGKGAQATQDEKPTRVGGGMHVKIRARGSALPPVTSTERSEVNDATA